jgi:hypothetical protein
MGKETKELKMDELEMINQNNDAAISDADLDKVAGGFMCLPLVAVKVASAIKGGGTGGTGGQNDPAQQFQQILQQLTQQG